MALFTILRQVNALAVLKKDLEPLKDDQSRAFKVKPMQPNNYNNIKFNFVDLSFILSTDSANILHYLLLENERFEQVLSTIKIRSKHLFNTIHPLIDSAGICDKSLPYKELEGIIGKSSLDSLIQITDLVYDHVYKTFESTLEIEEKLLLFAKSQYPNEKFRAIEKN